jgi:hypothetical protein
MVTATDSADASRGCLFTVPVTVTIPYNITTASTVATDGTPSLTSKASSPAGTATTNTIHWYYHVIHNTTGVAHCCVQH